MLKISPIKPNRCAAPFTYSSIFFDLSVHEAIDHIYIYFKTHGDIVNTRFLPSTMSILKKRFPQVLLTECFNEDNLCFTREVVQTELGHLFEHILIQYLQELRTDPITSADEFISGRTDWNWKRDPYGTFHIIITPSNMFSTVFKESLLKSITLLEEIMTHKNRRAVFV